MSIGAMKLALEQMDAALWRARAAAVRTSDHHIQIGHAIDAFYRLKEAIEQAQKQEPVGRFSKFTDGVWKEVTDTSAGQFLYASPPQRQPLTDEQIERLEAMCIDPIDSKGWGFLNRKSFARAIEAAHGITEEQK